ncbi:DEAD/DEAH box helicase [Corynebacterium variabile]|uniref:DEAD/DEAH box helicase n=1 Tax=Corynebacterium variabile TaxID=1727 RepID=UPI0028ABA723|nr:DEAD/DEAH box helicase [Corynebacterium variabile]
MASVHDVIDAFRDSRSTSEQGTQFEQLMVRWFELDPTLNEQYDRVWRWPDWPGRHNHGDNGIDIVAHVAETGEEFGTPDEFAAIQCKFYDPDHRLSKQDIDSFFTESGKAPFTRRVIISTTDKWGKNAEAALEGQQIPVTRISMKDLEDSPVSWDIAWPQNTLQIDLTPKKPHELRPHQTEAVDAVFRGWGDGTTDTTTDRGKLIMACGTGKTFTSLKIAERLAQDLDGKARILFAVPSISLLSQTLREWNAQTALDMRSFAVCSDNKVSRAAEDMSTEDVIIPVTTDGRVLAEKLSGHRRRAKGLTVVFTTYQSLPAIHEAQRHGADAFDLIICDEAHRTTGVTLAGEDASSFVKVHDPDFITATRRLYMTATPRLFDDTTKSKAEEHSAEIVSMDDLDTFGPEFHRLSFGEAVDRGLLTDYKVLVLTVDESVMAGKLQGSLATDGELSLDDASKIVGCWNGLAKRAGTAPDGSTFSPGEIPMRRAVAFAKDIRASKQVAEMFPQVVTAYQDLLNEQEDEGHSVEGTNRDLRCEVHHVDGTFNALQRNEELTWLKAPVGDDECRILTNARCLSEGVDVPALDAVLFLHPRNSVVDVVQSVGRVMRRSEGKDYGYIILPVAVPAGVSPSAALGNNRRFKTVWQVLNALRAHDERFNAMVNSIALNAKNPGKNGKESDRLLGGHVGPTSEDESLDSNSEGSGADKGSDKDADTANQMALFALSEWTQAIYTRIVDKVGTRTYWEDWAADVADIVDRLITRITAVYEDTGSRSVMRRRFDAFVQGLKDNLNDAVGFEDAVSMLAQHLITKPVFDALFEGQNFAEHNPVSKVMQKMVDALNDYGLESETAGLEKFYASVRVRASEVSSAEGKQQVIAELYEKFFRIGFKAQSDALGIVYTPVEIVDFILRAADAASREAFAKGLTDEGVHILDGFTGTGTFMTRLLQSGLIRPEDLARKYATELHANELMLLAYYIAAVNIEATYHALTRNPGQDATDLVYEPFPGIVMADTFQISERGDELDLEVFPTNNERIEVQLAAPINVIVGNPPYSKGQTSANDLNANLKYPTLDARIADTYAKYSTGANKNSLYDSYLRAFRWATDRIGNQGIVAFVSNGGWIDGNTADGIRLSLAEDYSRIYVYNLRGNMRKSDWKAEGGQIFGSGSQTTIAIWVGVKDPAHTGSCEVFYKDIGDYLSREEKLALVSQATLANLEWTPITPNSSGDWVNQRSEDFATWPVLGDKKGESDGPVFFRTYSSGLKTGRDPWCYSSSLTSLQNHVQSMVEQYAAAQALFQPWCDAKSLKHPKEADVTAFLKDHPEMTAPGSMSWNAGLKQQMARGDVVSENSESYQESLYRPFQKQHVYFDRQLNERVYRLPSMFPTPQHKNIGFYVVGAGSDKPFALFATTDIPDLAFWGSSSGQFFPRWTYEKSEPDNSTLEFSAASSDKDVDADGYRRIDNITDEILDIYREALGQDITKDDIFHFVYGQLHDPAYREAYAANLKKMLPHIETPTDRARFDALATAGRQLMDLHINFETVEPYPLTVEVKNTADPAERETWRVTKMKWKKTKGVTDHTTIIYNPKVTISGIPEEAEEYLLGSRSAMEWVIDRWKVSEDTKGKSGITNDPNDWCDEQDNPRYVIDLIGRVTTVAMETQKTIAGLSTTGNGATA